MSIEREQISDLLRQTYADVLKEPLPKRLRNALRDIMRKKP